MKAKLSVLAALLSLSFSGLVVSELTAQEINVQRELDGAKANYEWEIKNAKEDFLKGLEETIKSQAKSGNLDSVKALMKQKDVFAEAGELPDSIELKSFTENYEEKCRTAEQNYRSRVQDLIKNLTKALRIEDAEKTQVVLDRFENSVKKPIPPAETKPEPKENTGLFSEGSEFRGTITYENSPTDIQLKISFAKRTGTDSTVFVGIASWDGVQQLKFIGELSGNKFSMYSAEKIGPLPIFPVIYQGLERGGEINGEWYPKVGMGKSVGKFFLKPISN